MLKDRKVLKDHKVLLDLKVLQDHKDHKVLKVHVEVQNINTALLPLILTPDKVILDLIVQQLVVLLKCILMTLMLTVLICKHGLGHGMILMLVLLIKQ